jgi:TusA-related sulfurtransferase
MHLGDPVNIMSDYCIPDKKKLIKELSRLTPGQTIQIKIDNCITSRAMVEGCLKNKWCRIVKVVENDDSSILHISLETNA